MVLNFLAGDLEQLGTKSLGKQVYIAQQVWVLDNYERYTIISCKSKTFSLKLKDFGSQLRICWQISFELAFNRGAPFCCGHMVGELLLFLIDGDLVDFKRCEA